MPLWYKPKIPVLKSSYHEFKWFQMFSSARRATPCCLRSLYASPLSSLTASSSACPASTFSASPYSNIGSPVPNKILHSPQVNSKVFPLLAYPAPSSVRRMGSAAPETDQEKESKAEKKRAAQLAEVGITQLEETTYFLRPPTVLFLGWGWGSYDFLREPIIVVYCLK